MAEAEGKRRQEDDKGVTRLLQNFSCDTQQPEMAITSKLVCTCPSASKSRIQSPISSGGAGGQLHITPGVGTRGLEPLQYFNSFSKAVDMLGWRYNNPKEAIPARMCLPCSTLQQGIAARLHNM